MDKVAQKRRLRNKVRETLNAPTEKLMGAFSPQFVELMDKLRETDDQAREQAADLKDLLKLAKTNFNRREYMTAIAYVGRFHDKVETIINEFDQLGTAVDIKHHEFLFGDIEPEHLQYLTQQLGPKFKKKPMSDLMKRLEQHKQSKASLHSEAGIADWWHNLTSDRGRALSAWEKRFPKEAKELKRQLANILTKSEGLLDYLLDAFKTLASFRSTRRLEEYLQTTAKLKVKYISYHTAFKTFYNTYVSKFVELQQQEQNKKEQEAVSPNAIAPMPLPRIPITDQSILEPKVEQPVVEPVSGVAGYVPNPDPNKAGPPRSFQDFLAKPIPQPFPQQSLEEALNEQAKQKASPEESEESEEAPATQHEPQLLLMPLGEPTPIKPEAQSSKPVKSEMSPKLQQYIKNLKEKKAGVFDDDEKTMVSPISTLPHKDRPIEVSIVDTFAPAPTSQQEEIIPIYPEFDEEDDEKTIVSPISQLLSHKDRPIEVSVIEPSTKSHQEFLDRLTSLSQHDPFKMAIEMMKYAEMIKQDEPTISQQLLQLSKKLLAK